MNDPKLVIVPPGASAVNYELLLPFLGSRIESKENELGRKSRRPAEVCGKFFEDDARYRNRDRDALSGWKRGVSIDNTRGYVMLGAPAYLRGDGGVKHPELYLRIGYGYRQTPFGSRYHRQYDKATGNNLGIANGVVPRTDVNEYRIVNYSSDYANLSVTGAFTNTATVDTILNEAATENVKQYQTLPAPQRMVFTPIKPIDLNGVTMQVSFSGGSGRISEAVASIGQSYDLSQTPAKAKLQREVQARLIESQVSEFRSNQEAIQGVKPKSDAAQAFDASGMA